jgi:chromosome segregation ATPase
MPSMGPSLAGVVLAAVILSALETRMPKGTGAGQMGKAKAKPLTEEHLVLILARLDQQDRKIDEQLRGTTVLLESMQEQNRATIEAVHALEGRMNARFDDLERRLTLRIEALEIAVRKNSEDIRKNSEDIRKNSEDIRKNSEDIRKNSEDIQELQARVDALALELKRKPDADALKALEERVARLEQRIGI